MVINIVNWGQMQLKFNKFYFESIKLAELIDIVLSSESLNAKIKNNKLVNAVDPAFRIISDAHALEFVFRNLVANANKFTNDGSITVSAESSEDKALITLADTGVGIPDEQIAKILANEQYVTTTGTNNEKGNGLGLMLVKEFIEHMNGRITIESELGKGTRFKILI